MEISEKEYKERKKAIEAESDDQLFYWQSYGYVGNALSLWRIGSSGYTTDINEAQQYTKEQTLGQLGCRRDQDTFWRVEDLHKAVIEVVDSQRIKDKSY